MESFEKVALTALEEAIIKSALVVIDEIGYMELKSRRFRELLVKALDSPAPLLSTVMMSRYEFTDTIKSRPDVEVIRVNTLNRDSLVREITEKILNLSGTA